MPNTSLDTKTVRCEKHGASYTCDRCSRIGSGPFTATHTACIAIHNNQCPECVAEKQRG